MDLATHFPLPAQARVTVFAPHPDDEAFGCGGLLHQLVLAGHCIRVIIVSDGGYGEFGRDIAARQRESQAAAQLLGYPPPIFWGFPDQGLSQAAALSPACRDELTQHPPQLVLAPSPWEVHPDHLALCQVVTAACHALAGEGRAPDLVFYEVGVPMPRPFIIDISAAAPLKQQAMHCFASQNAIQAYASQIAGLNTYRGYTLPRHAAWGEAYYRPPPHLRSPQDIAAISQALAVLDAGQPAPADRLAQLQHAYEQLAAHCQAIETSTTWRLTAPVRRLVSRLRRLS